MRYVLYGSFVSDYWINLSLRESLFMSMTEMSQFDWLTLQCLWSVKRRLNWQGQNLYFEFDNASFCACLFNELRFITPSLRFPPDFSCYLAEHFLYGNSQSIIKTSIHLWRTHTMNMISLLSVLWMDGFLSFETKKLTSTNL